MLKNQFDNFFSRFFPVPASLFAPSFGLDISDESIKFLQLLNTNDGIRLGKYGERKIPIGVIESGKIKNPQIMEQVLISLRNEVGLKYARVSLPEEQVYLFKMTLEKENLTNIRDSIELALEEHVPITAEDAIFDYELIGQDKKSVDLQVATIPKNIIESYLTVFKDSNIKIQSFELEAQAVFRSVVSKGDMNTYMIVDFGDRRAGIFIVSRGIMMFTSTLDVGGVMLTDMIAKSFKITFSEAEKMKRQYGLSRNAPNKELFSVLLNSVSVLRDEILKNFLYWQTHKDEEGRDNPAIKKIILCGGDANLVGLVDYLAVSMKTPVELANVWVNILNTKESVPDMDFGQTLSYAASFGLALGDYEKN